MSPNNNHELYRQWPYVNRDRGQNVAKDDLPGMSMYASWEGMHYCFESMLIFSGKLFLVNILFLFSHAGPLYELHVHL